MKQLTDEQVMIAMDRACDAQNEVIMLSKIKPVWKDAPPWAVFLTHDRMGWRWWAIEPILHEENGCYHSRYRQSAAFPRADQPHMEARPYDSTSN